MLQTQCIIKSTFLYFPYSKLSSMLNCVSQSRDQGPAAQQEPAVQPNRPQLEQRENDNILRLLSWNIEGLGTQLTVERAMAVCDEIESRQPDVVYLQEIVPQTWDTITTRLKSKYLFYRDEATHGLYPVRYYHILMIRVGSAVVVQGELEVTKFPNSTQDRLLLQLAVRFYNHDIQLFTSHLESLVQNAAERKKQLRTVFDLMSEASKNFSQTCIFGGDLNLMDKELNQVGLPEDFADVWEASGADTRHKYTWDTTEPRFRLDRIYVTPKESQLRPIKFELIGGSLLKNLKAYPSDHLGLWSEFVLSGKSVVEENSEHSETTNKEEERDTTIDVSIHDNNEGTTDTGNLGNSEEGDHGNTEEETGISSHGNNEEAGIDSDGNNEEEAGIDHASDEGATDNQT